MLNKKTHLIVTLTSNMFFKISFEKKNNLCNKLLDFLQIIIHIHQYNLYKNKNKTL